MSVTCFRGLAFLILLIALPVSAKIHYEITITQPQHHWAEVVIGVPEGLETVNVYLPNWRTGRYEIINQANGIRGFNAQTIGGEPLIWKRVSKSHWQISNPAKSELTIGYQLYANELAARTRHIDSSHAYLDATAVFMYVPEMMESEHIVTLKVPKQWQSFSGMTQLVEHQFSAKNYHQLASSPIETGVNQLREFSQDGKNYQLVVWGTGNYDIDRMATDLERLVAQASIIWKGYPFEKYVFIVHATTGVSGATEHINSTVIQRPRFSFAPREDYLKFLRTAAHEYIHTWNVKAYRPANLVPYDYQNENYSDLLWIAEGTTSYFQDHLLLTAGLQSVNEYLKELAERVKDYAHKPGRLEQSLAESSYEKWIAQGGNFANNHSVNIYTEGFIASWLFDVQMLDDSDLKSGFKKLHGRLYSRIDQLNPLFQRYFAAPYTAEEIRVIAGQLTGKNYHQWWERHIESPLAFDIEALLNKAGLAFADVAAKDKIVFTGFSGKDLEGLYTLTEVEKTGPAWLAGLTIDDQIVAFNGSKVTEKTLPNRLEQFKEGESVDIIYFRNDQLRKTKLEFGVTTKKTRKIELQKSPSDMQKAFFKAWLGVEFPEKGK